jgi:hypothetical protein
MTIDLLFEGLHGPVRHGENISFAKPVGLRLMSSQQLTQKVLSVGLVFRTLLSFFEFGDRNSSNESILGRQKRNISPQRIPSKELIEERDLSNDAVVPLGIVDGLDCIVHIKASIKETKFSGEGYFAKNLDMIPVSARPGLA